MDSWNLMVGLMSGVIGSAYVVYGRRQGHPIALVAGLVMIVTPMLVDAVWAILSVLVIAASVPWWLRR